jgi:hypothetical protein
VAENRAGELVILFGCYAEQYCAGGPPSDRTAMPGIEDQVETLFYTFWSAVGGVACLFVQVQLSE